MTTNIEAAARRVAEVKHRQAEADAALKAANSAQDSVQARVGALQLERSMIIEAARSGVAADNAGLRLAVLDEDIRDIQPLIRDARDGVSRAQAEAERLAQAVAAAERDLALEQDRQVEAMLIERAESLAALLATAVSELKVVQRKRGGRPSWAPGKELVAALTSLRLVADNRALAA
jgi:hypothetical protein